MVLLYRQIMRLATLAFAIGAVGFFIFIVLRPSAPEPAWTDPPPPYIADFLARIEAKDKSALAELTALAQSGDAGAQNALGRLHHDGAAGLRRDLAQAETWYRLSAESGYLPAMMNLGLLFDYDREDFGEAVTWYEKLHEAGDPRGSFRAGQLYFLGNKTLRKNQRKASELLQAGADGGVSFAMVKLSAIAARKGQKDEEIELLVRAALLGDKGALSILKLLEHPTAESFSWVDFTCVLVNETWLERRRYQC